VVSAQVDPFGGGVGRAVDGRGDAGLQVLLERRHVAGLRLAGVVVRTEVVGVADTPLLEDIEITVFQDAVVLQPLEVVVDPGPRPTGEIDDRIVALSRSQSRLVRIAFAIMLIVPGGAELDEVQLYESGVRTLPVLGDLEQATSDLPGLVLDLALERADHSVNAKRIPCEQVL